MCGYTFWDYRGGGLTRQPMGPPVNQGAITTATSINHLNSGRFSLRCCTFRRTHTSAHPIRILFIRLALTLTLSRPSRYVPSARLMVGASSGALWFVRDFSRDCLFWDERGGELTRQLVDPRVDIEMISTALSTNCVNSRSFRSRCWAFRRTHTSTDQIRQLRIRLALPLTLSLPSGLAPSARLMVYVSPRALWLVRNFSCDFTFRDERGRGLTGQPMGPQVDKANDAALRDIINE